MTKGFPCVCWTGNKRWKDEERRSSSTSRLKSYNITHHHHHPHHQQEQTDRHTETINHHETSPPCSHESTRPCAWTGHWIYGSGGLCSSNYKCWQWGGEPDCFHPGRGAGASGFYTIRQSVSRIGALSRVKYLAALPWHTTRMDV